MNRVRRFVAWRRHGLSVRFAWGMSGLRWETRGPRRSGGAIDRLNAWWYRVCPVTAATLRRCEAELTAWKLRALDAEAQGGPPCPNDQ